MNVVNQSAFLKALGWSLLDSFWQMGLLWLLYVCLTANGKRFQSRQRHTLALLSLAGGSLWFLVTLIINFYKAAAAPEIITLTAAESAATATSNASFLTRLAPALEPVLPLLSVVYLLAAGFLFIRFYRQYRYTRILFKQGLTKVHPEWRVFLQQAAAHMGLKKKISIWFSSLADTPLTLGFLKPVILLPVAAVNHLTIKQAEAIILHELNHIRRNDYLVNLLIACVDILLFFNPFARLLTGLIRQEREHSCDDFVLQYRYDAGNYAQALLTLEQNRDRHNLALAVAATGKDQKLLLNRVKRMLHNEPVTASLNQKLFAYLLSALLIGFIGLYNPGKIIVKQIDEAAMEMPASTETPVAFATPAPDKEAIAVKAQPEPAPRTKKDAEADDDATEETKFDDLEAFIEWATDAKLAAVTEEWDHIPEQVAGFVNNIQIINYTLPETPVAVAPVTYAAIDRTYPYVPNSSFSYQVIEDTTLPKKYILTEADIRAKEAMANALLALKEIDWKKVEKEIAATGTYNVENLQGEIQKALKEVDWKKINQQARDAVQDLQKEKVDAFRVQLGNYQQQKTLEKERQKKLEQQILLERLEQHQQLRKLEQHYQDQKEKCTCPDQQNSGVKKKKIVHI